MAIRKHPAISKIPMLTPSNEGFKQIEVAEMLGAQKYQVSRDCKILWPDRNSFDLLTASQVKTLYCVAVFRHVQYASGRNQIVNQEIYDFINKQTDTQIWSFVELAGGSQADCNERIEEVLVKRHQKRIEGNTINIAYSTAQGA